MSITSGDLVLKDSDVSATHANVKFNFETGKWKITDLGSLNGTLLNCAPIHHTEAVWSRNHGRATVLSNEDIITFGDPTNVLVHVTEKDRESLRRERGGFKDLNEMFPNHNLRNPGIAMASYPESKRIGGNTLHTEDFGLSQYPLPGVEKSQGMLIIKQLKRRLIPVQSMLAISVSCNIHSYRSGILTRWRCTEVRMMPESKQMEIDLRMDDDPQNF